MYIDFPAATQVVSIPEPTPGVARYWLYMKMGDLPQMIPLDNNPRDQKLSTHIARSIRATALSPVQDFHLMNRGLLLVVSRAERFVSSTGQETLRVWFDEKAQKKRLGLGDGGTTYKVICDLLADPVSKEQLVDKLLTVEVLAQVQAEAITKIVGSRNRAVQVKDESLHDHAGAFDFIKEALEGTQYGDVIRYRENAPGTVEIRDIMLMLTLLNPTVKPRGRNGETRECHGTNVWGQQLNLTKIYTAASNKKSYAKFQHILKDIMYLHEVIGATMADHYNAAQDRQKKTRAKSLTTIFTERTPYGGGTATPFLGLESKVGCYPRKALWFASVGALRSFIVDTGDAFKFVLPVEVIASLFQENALEIVRSTKSELEQYGGDLNELARKSVWFWTAPYQRLAQAQKDYLDNIPRVGASRK